MYVLNDFNAALRSLVLTHAGLDVDIKLPTVKQHVNGDIHFYSSVDLQNLVQKLMDNLTIIDRCTYTPGYFSIWLKKDLWTSSVINEISTSGCKYGQSEQYKSLTISLNTDECNDSVSYLRIALLKNAVQNLCEINGCTIGSNGINLMVSKKNNPNNSNLMLCGSVVCNITAEEYKQRKHEAVAKMCVNHTTYEKYPISIISKLCHMSIIYELLSVRHNKVVNAECDLSMKDSGIFIMYNYSRLCQVWTAFENGVSENYYKSLPDTDSIHFELLTYEEEWILVFNYLSVYPSVVQDSVKHLQSYNVDVHKLCTFLMEMSSTVSLFYHRHHILSNPVSSLLPLMYARLYLVKASIQVYENVFKLLGIEAVSEM